MTIKRETSFKPLDTFVNLTLIYKRWSASTLEVKLDGTRLLKEMIKANF